MVQRIEAKQLRRIVCCGLLEAAETILVVSNDLCLGVLVSHPPEAG